MQTLDDPTFLSEATRCEEQGLPGRDRFLLALYLVALGLFSVGTLGLLGSKRDPLFGVFLMPLGLPWNLLLDGLPVAFVPGGCARPLSDGCCDVSLRRLRPRQRRRLDSVRTALGRA